MSKSKTVNVWFQSCKGGLRCPSCNRILGDLLTEMEVMSCKTGEQLRDAIRRHWTHGWYRGVTWHTGQRFCRACVADTLKGPEWDSVRLHIGTDYVLSGRGVAIPAWLVVAWSDCVRPKEIVRIA